MDEKLLKKDKEIALLINYCKTLQNEKENESSLLKQLNTVVDENLILCQEIKKLEEFIDKQDDYIKNLTTDIVDKNNIINKQNDYIKNLLNDIADKDNMISNQNQDIINLTNKIRDLEEQLQELKKLIDNIKNFITTINSSQKMQLFNPSKIIDNLMILFYNRLCGTIYQTPPLSPKKSLNRS
jgi:uncharacterized coiled-coil protein SlyX